MTVRDWLYRISISWRGPAYWHWRHFGDDYVTRRVGDVWHSEVLGRAYAFNAVSAWQPPGETIHIVLSGPSVGTITDPRRIALAPTLCVNGSFRLFESIGVRPDLYLLSDGGFVRRQWPTFLQGAAISRALCADHRLLLQIARGDPALLRDRPVYTFDNLVRPYGRSSRWQSRADTAVLHRCGRDYAFSVSDEEGYFMSRTVAYLALQIAASQRPKRIVFFGMDFGGGRRYYEERSPERSMLDSDYEIAILPHMRFASRVLATAGIEVLNASPDSRLPDEVFPRVEPNAYLDGCLIG